MWVHLHCAMCPLVLQVHGERARPSDDRIKLAVEACLRHSIQHAPGFESSSTSATSLQPSLRERLGNVLNALHSAELRSELQEKLQGALGGRAAAAGGGGGAGDGGPGLAMASGFAAVGDVLRSQAETVGQMLEQGAGQMRERLSVRRG